MRGKKEHLTKHFIVCIFFYLIYLIFLNYYCYQCFFSLNILFDEVSLFREEISTCAAVHMRYVMDTCDRVWSINLLPPMMVTSFVLIELTVLIVSELKYWEKPDHIEQVLTSHFWGGKESSTSLFLLNHIIFN